MAEQDRIKFQEKDKGKAVARCENQPKTVRCTLLHGSAWRTERKYLRRYRGTFDIFFGNEHRMRREEMEEQFNKEAKRGWRFAADAARITDENASSEDRRHTSGGVSAAIDSHPVIDKDEGRLVQPWVNVRGSMKVLRRKLLSLRSKAGEDCQTPLVGRVRCQHEPRRF